MRELRFHKALYPESALAEALSVFADYATLERADEAEHVVVRVTAQAPARERRVAGELGNYALGVSVRDLGEAR